MEHDIDRRIEDAVTRAFSAGVGDKRFIDITRIPLICQSIVGIDTRLKGIEGNLTWGIRIVLGAVILGVIAVILKS